MPTSYTAIPDTDIDTDSPLTGALVTLIRDNPIAITEGAAGAPSIANAALANHPWGTADIEAAAIGQAELKTAAGSASTTSAGVKVTLPGGAYGSYPRTKSSNSGSGFEVIAHIGTPTSQTTSTSFIALVVIGNEGGASTTIEQRYIQASPPYDLGDGEIPLFIFVNVDSSGKVISVYEAPEAPWHYNGPTNIKADLYKNGIGYQLRKDPDEINAALIAAKHPAGLTAKTALQLSMSAYSDYIEAFGSAKNVEREITQELKNRDMVILPRPMEPGTGETVVMLDPMSPLTLKLAEMKQHDEFSLNDLLHNGDLIVSSTKLKRAGPPGVDVVGYKFR